MSLLLDDLRTALAADSHGPSCRCGDWSRAVALILTVAERHDCVAHPAVVDSVARTFAHWDGLDAAHRESVTRFRDWHTEARAEKEVTA